MILRIGGPAITDLKLTNDVHFKDIQDTKSELGSIISSALTALIVPLIIIAIVVVVLMVFGGGIKGISDKMGVSAKGKGIDPAITKEVIQDATIAALV